MLGIYKKRKWVRSLLLVACCFAGVISDSQAVEEEKVTWTTSEGKILKGAVLVVDDKSVSIGFSDKKKASLSRHDLIPADQERVTAWENKHAPSPDFSRPDHTVILSTVPHEMVYDKTSFTVKPGGIVRLVLVNGDDMQHNLVICRPGKQSGMDVAQAAWALGAKGIEKQYIPEHPKVLFHTGLIESGDSEAIYFAAPREPGEYPYVCTLPGHAMMMKGVMTVGGTPLQNLSYSIFKGEWNSVTDFSELDPESTVPLPENMISLQAAKGKRDYGLIFEGDLRAPKDGEYSFTMTSNDGSQLYIDDKLVVDADGSRTTRTKTASVTLKAGMRKLRLSYFQKRGDQTLELRWSGPGFRNKYLSPNESKKQTSSGPTGIPIAPENGEAVMYRNFISGASPRAIGVGYPEKVNICFDASNMNLAMLWDGPFIDGARHWKWRGQGYQPPLNPNPIAMNEGVQFAELQESGADWPLEHNRDARTVRSSAFRFKGYSLDDKRYPTFLYSYKSAQISDVFTPLTNIDSKKAGFERTIGIKQAESLSDLWFRVVDGPIEKEGDVFVVDGRLSISFEGSSKAVFLEHDGDDELRLPIDMQGGEARIQLTYTWERAQ